VAAADLLQLGLIGDVTLALRVWSGLVSA